MLLLLARGETLWDNEFSLVQKKNIACNPMGVVWFVEFTEIKLKYPHWVSRYIIIHLPDLMLLLLACSGTIWDDEFSLVYKQNFDCQVSLTIFGRRF